MDAERMNSLQVRLRANRTRVRTDEAARAALVLPFIQALGYDIFDPEEVVPGFTKGQGRADFVVLDGERHRMLISLAQEPRDLTSDRAARLRECFANVGATTAILTDGSLFRVHADADRPGEMDEEPLLSVDLGGTADVDGSVLTHLERDTFDIAGLAETARSRRYEDAVRRAVGDELADPSEGFVEIVSQRMRGAGIDPRDDLVRSVSAITLATVGGMTATVGTGDSPAAEIAAGDERIVTADEMLGYHIILAIAARHDIDTNRIKVRPAQSYCAILLDDNNRKAIARLHFNSQTVRYVGTFVDKKETRRQVSGPNAIYGMEEYVVDRLKELDPKAFGLAETMSSRSREEDQTGPEAADEDAEARSRTTDVADVAATTETPEAGSARDERDEDGSADRGAMPNVQDDLLGGAAAE